MGTISREDSLLESENPQRLYVWEIKMNIETLWIVGFVDGEGCFHVSINKQKSMVLEKQVLPEFSVVQHERSIDALYALKSFFKCGEVVNNHGDRKAYRVRGHKNLSSIIVPFFEKHKLKTYKRFDFEIFRDIVRMMGNGEHLTPEGLQLIEKYITRMNRKGISAHSAEKEENT